MKKKKLRHSIELLRAIEAEQRNRADGLAETLVLERSTQRGRVHELEDQCRKVQAEAFDTKRELEKVRAELAAEQRAKLELEHERIRLGEDYDRASDRLLELERLALGLREVSGLWAGEAPAVGKARHGRSVEALEVVSERMLDLVHAYGPGDREAEGLLSEFLRKWGAS